MLPILDWNGIEKSMLIWKQKELPLLYAAALLLHAAIDLPL
jgi:hypothetical protein